MKAALANDPVRSRPTTQSTFWPGAVALISLTLIWLEVVRHLQSEWSYNPQYSYGWSVPFLVAYMIWRRWPSRPEPVPGAGQRLASLLLVSGTLLLLAIRFVAEANPDWRFLSWTFALTAVALSFTIFYLGAGKSWVRHFSFPVLFFLVAVPWPTGLEQSVTQTLMHAVTAINVFGLNLLGIPALQRGNVIEVASGLIGIEEACSGVRSLQATLMISLFLGELYSFKAPRRLLLVLLGALLAFFCNLVRTAILVWVGAHQGVTAIHGWHDPAGLAILLICLVGLWLLSLALRRREGSEEQGDSSVAIDRPFRLPASLATSVVVCLLLGEIVVQTWYQIHTLSVATSRWSVRWPSDQSAYQTLPIPPETQGLLRYDEGGGATWKGHDSVPWVMYFFRWLPGRTAALFVKNHRPDVCLPASGMTMLRDDGVHWEKINGVSLPIRIYRFDRSGSPLHVLYCYWDGRSAPEDGTRGPAEDWSPSGRIRNALSGRREIGAQMLEVVVWGYDDDAKAAAALRQKVQAIVTSI